VFEATIVWRGGKKCLLNTRTDGNFLSDDAQQGLPVSEFVDVLYGVYVVLHDPISGLN
jgi:hypothetical protein